MRQAVVYKEWAPDQPDLADGLLVTAKGVIHSVAGYKPQATLVQYGSALMSASAVSACIMSGGATKFDNDIYAADSSRFFVSGAGSAFTARGTASGDVAFVQFDDLMIAASTGQDGRKHTLNSVSNFSTLAASGTAPPASVAGVINRFVIFGDLGTAGSTATSLPNSIRWSGIDAPTSWPAPNSATAIAQQAGQQDMDSRWGQVKGIFGGDQHGVILQTGAITRMTYVGPPAVFQFDLVSNATGSVFRKAAVQAGAWVYFLSREGFCRTDGVSVERIGAGKVDRFFWDAVYQTESKICAAYDPTNKLVCWAYPSSAGSASTCNRMLSFCEDTSQWTYSDINADTILTPGRGYGYTLNTTLLGFLPGASVALGTFSGTAGSAVIETADAEFNPGGRSFVDGVKPNVESTATAPAMTVAIGYRDDLGASPTYTSEVTATSATGFADFRVDAKYTRARVTITGNFDRTTGFIARLQQSSER